LKSLLIALSLLLLPVVSAEEPVRITTFTLRDGRTLDAIRYASVGSIDFRCHVVTTADGKKSTLLEKRHSLARR